MSGLRVERRGAVWEKLGSTGRVRGYLALGSHWRPFPTKKAGSVLQSSQTTCCSRLMLVQRVSSHLTHFGTHGNPGSVFFPETWKLHIGPQTVAFWPGDSRPLNLARVDLLCRRIQQPKCRASRSQNRFERVNTTFERCICLLLHQAMMFVL